LVFRIEYIAWEISAFKSQFCNVFCSHKDEQNALKRLKKEVILSWKSLENQVGFLYDPVITKQQSCVIVAVRRHSATHRC